MRRIFRLALLAVVLLAACDDPLEVARNPIGQDTVVLYSVARPDLIGQPSAFDFVNQRPVRLDLPGEAALWDMAIGEEAGGFVLIPASVFPQLNSRAGIAVAEGQSFTALERAPSDTSAYRRTGTPLRAGSTYIIRTRRVTSGCVFFAKLRQLSSNVAEGTVTFEYLVNPNCNDRDLVPEDEE